MTDEERRLLGHFLAYLHSVGLAICAPASAAPLWLEPGEEVRPQATVALRWSGHLEELFDAWLSRQQKEDSS